MQRASWTTLHSISQPRLLQLAQATVISRRLMFGTSVYLLPLRHPEQVASLDHLTEGRFIFGVGVGGEFPKEYEASGVPLKERGARLEKGIPLLRELWSGEPVTHAGRLYQEVFGSATWIVQGLLHGAFHFSFGPGLIFVLLPAFFAIPWAEQRTRNTSVGMVIHGVMNGQPRPNARLNAPLVSASARQPLDSRPICTSSLARCAARVKS